jgi:hypothetical protein
LLSAVSRPPSRRGVTARIAARLLYCVSVVEAVNNTILKRPPLFGDSVDPEPLNQCLQSFTAWVGVGVEAGDGLVVVEGAQRRYVTGFDAVGREGAGVEVLWSL